MLCILGDVCISQQIDIDDFQIQLWARLSTAEWAKIVQILWYVIYHNHQSRNVACLRSNFLIPWSDSRDVRKTKTKTGGWNGNPFGIQVLSSLWSTIWCELVYSSWWITSSADGFQPPCFKFKPVWLIGQMGSIAPVNLLNVSLTALFPVSH